MPNVLFDGLLAAGMTEPGRRFARLESGLDITYGELDAASGRYANVLVEAGLRPGDRVAMQAEKSIDSLFLYLAALRAGGVFLPLNTAYTPTEIAYFLEDATPKVFVCSPERLDTLAPLAAAIGASVETLGIAGTPGQSEGTLSERAGGAAATFDIVARSGSDLAAILYTSGTTGRSKGAMLTHDNLLSNAMVLKDTWRFTSDDVLLHVLPIFHTHGLFVATNTVLVAGGSLVLLPKFDADLVFRHLPDCTSMMAVPTYYVRMLADGRLDRATTAHVRLFTSGSAPLLAETHREFEARTGQRILERYGMTETNMITSNPFEGERRPGTVGLPLPGCELRIADPESARLLPRGEIGVLEVKGPNVFAGYWQMPEKTASEFRPDGFFVTGDLGYLDEDGYAVIVGRSKDLVITGGYNVYPKEVELVIDALAGVVESAVIGVPHPDFGEAVVAVVVATGQLDELAMMAALKEKIARFKQPKRIVFVDELPRNTMGKVQKKVLRDRFGSLLSST